MRVFMTSFAALLTLVAFGPGVAGTALGGDNGTNAGAIVGTPGVAGAPAIPPVPAPVPGRTFAPAPAPVPAPIPALLGAPTLAPPSEISPAPAGQVRNEVGNPGTPQTSGVNVNVGAPGNVNVGVAVNQGGDQWRYRWHNNNWWYWTA